MKRAEEIAGPKITQIWKVRFVVLLHSVDVLPPIELFLRFNFPLKTAHQNQHHFTYPFPVCQNRFFLAQYNLLDLYCIVPPLTFLPSSFPCYYEEVRRNGSFQNYVNLLL